MKNVCVIFEAVLRFSAYWFKFYPILIPIPFFVCFKHNVFMLLNNLNDVPATWNVILLTSFQDSAIANETYSWHRIVFIFVLLFVARLLLGYSWHLIVFNFDLLFVARLLLGIWLLVQCGNHLL